MKNQEENIARHDSDCSVNNVGVPSMLGPCDCSLSYEKQKCTDERPCTNCFSGNGGCMTEKLGTED